MNLRKFVLLDLDFPFTEFSEVRLFGVVELWSGYDQPEGPRLGLLAEISHLADHLRGARIGTHPLDVLEAAPGSERVEKPRIFHAANQCACSRRVGQIEEVIGKAFPRLHELFFSAFLDAP